MGSIIDRKGIRTPIVAGLLIYGLAGGAGVLIGSFGLLLASRAILGVALASFFAATNTLILNSYRETERVRIMGWHSSAQSLGGIIWPMVGGGLGALSWHMPFAVYLMAIPIGFIAAAVLPRESTERPEDMPVTDTSVLGIFREKPILLLVCSLMFYINFHLYTIIIYLPQLLETYGISNSFLLSLFIAAITVASGTIAFFYWRFRQLLSYRPMVTIALGLCAAAFALITMTASIPLIVAAVMLFGIGMAFIYPTCFLWVGDLVPPDFRGRFSAYLLMTAFMAQFAVPVVFAPVLAGHGLTAIFFCGILSSLIWLAMVICFGKQIRSA